MFIIVWATWLKISLHSLFPLRGGFDKCIGYNLDRPYSLAQMSNEGTGVSAHIPWEKRFFTERYFRSMSKHSLYPGSFSQALITTTIPRPLSISSSPTRPAPLYHVATSERETCWGKDDLSTVFQRCLHFKFIENMQHNIL